MNDNPKNNILLSENIRQKRLRILEYFDAYICHHYQPNKIPTIRCYFSDYRSYYTNCLCSRDFNEETGKLHVKIDSEK